MASMPTVEVEAGPNLRACLDVLDFAGELYALVPEWHESELAELKNRATGLAEMISASLSGEFRKGK